MIEIQERRGKPLSAVRLTLYSVDAARWFSNKGDALRCEKDREKFWRQTNGRYDEAQPSLMTVELSGDRDTLQAIRIKS